MKHICIPALLLATACAGPDLPIPATYTPTDVTNFAATFVSINISPNSFFLPGTGSASYSGRFHTGLTGGGDMLGDIDITANFGAGTVSGTLDTINLIGSSTYGSQTMGGSVAFTGTITGTTLAATGSGTLTAVAAGQTTSGATTTSISGQFRDYFSFYDAISGTLDINTGAIGISETGAQFYAQ